MLDPDYLELAHDLRVVAHVFVELAQHRVEGVDELDVIGFWLIRRDRVGRPRYFDRTKLADFGAGQGRYDCVVAFIAVWVRLCLDLGAAPDVSGGKTDRVCRGGGKDLP